MGRISKSKIISVDSTRSDEEYCSVKGDMKHYGKREGQDRPRILSMPMKSEGMCNWTTPNHGDSGGGTALSMWDMKRCKSINPEQK